METKPLTEHEEILKTRRGIRVMKDDVDSIKIDITEIKTALLGSALTQDGGLIRKIIENESRIDKLTIRVGELESSEGNKKVFKNKIWGIAKKAWAFILAIILLIAGAVAGAYAAKYIK